MHKSHLFLFVLSSALLTVCLLMPLALASESTFSVVWITDTQYLSQTYPDYFDSMCQWIVNNRDAYNVKMVVHTGDIVNYATDLSQWKNANHSMGILLDNDIPYCWDAGNHDQSAGSWDGKDFVAFNVTLMEQKAYWTGDSFDGKNTAVSFNFSGYNFLIVNVEFHANSSELQWANDVLDAHPNSHVILATHAYIDEICGYDAWALELQDTVLANHSNVFMTLNGHYYSNGNANRTRVDQRDELFFNRQNLDDQKGGATVRILTFDLAQGKINVKTYETYAGQFVTDSDNEFTLETPFVAIPEFPSGPLLLTFALAASSFAMVRRFQKRRTMRV